MKFLIWKEWRETRTSYFLFGILFISITLMGRYLLSHIINSSFFISCFNFCFFVLAIGCPIFVGSAVFAGEITHETTAFLFGVPISSIRLFWTKYFFHLACIMLIFLIPTAITNLNHIAPLLVFAPPAALYTLGVCSGLLLQKQSTAILASPFVAILICISGILLAPCILTIPSLPTAYAIACIVFSIMAVVFAFATWQSHAKGVPSGKRILYVWLGCFAASLIIHQATTAFIHHKFLAAVEQARKEGFKMSFREILPPPIPDDKNAAVVYEKAFTLADQLKEQYPYDWSGKTPPIEIFDRQRPIILKLLSDKKTSHFFTLLEQAASMSECRFNIITADDDFISARFPHLAKIRTLAQMNAFRTMLLTRERRYPAAFSSAITGLKIADALVQEPTVISQLVRVAVDKTGTDGFQTLLYAFPIITVADGKKVLDILRKKNRRLTLGIEGELAGLMSFFQNKPAGLISMLVAVNATHLKNLRIYDLILQPLYWYQAIGYINRMHVMANAIRTNSISVFEKIDRELINIMRSSRINSMRNAFSCMMLPALHRLGIQQEIYNVNLDELTLALALKLFKSKHGDYPADMSVLVPAFLPSLPSDPFSPDGKAGYQYRREGNGFIVYSIGENGRDDNGIYDQKYEARYDDIAFKIPN